MRIRRYEFDTFIRLLEKHLSGNEEPIHFIEFSEIRDRLRTAKHALSTGRKVVPHLRKRDLFMFTYLLDQQVDRMLESEKKSLGRNILLGQLREEGEPVDKEAYGRMLKRMMDISGNGV